MRYAIYEVVVVRREVIGRFDTEAEARAVVVAVFDEEIADKDSPMAGLEDGYITKYRVKDYAGGGVADIHALTYEDLEMVSVY